MSGMAIFLDMPVFLLIEFAFLFFSLSKNGLSRLQYNSIRLTFALAFLLTVAEVLYDGYLVGYLKLSYDGLYSLNILYGFIFLILSCAWCMMGFTFMRKIPKGAKAALCFLFLMTIIEMIMGVGFRNTDLFVYLERGEVKYGSLSYVSNFLRLLPILLLMAIAFYNYFSKEEYVNRDKVIPFILFSVCDTAALITQNVILTSFIIVLTNGLAAMYLFITISVSHILEDETTGLPNRRAFIRDIEGLMNNKIGWSVMSFDVDGRKSIYQEFGKGEKDIINGIITEVLEEVCVSYSCKAYVFREDRFVLVCENDNSMYASQICDGVYNHIEDLSLDKKIPYRIRTTSDFLCIDENTTLTIPDVISVLNKQMLVKKEKI